jgi:hypothetical protein
MASNPFTGGGGFGGKLLGILRALSEGARGYGAYQQYGPEWRQKVEADELENRLRALTARGREADIEAAPVNLESRRLGNETARQRIAEQAVENAADADPTRGDTMPTFGAGGLPGLPSMPVEAPPELGSPPEGMPEAVFRARVAGNRKSRKDVLQLQRDIAAGGRAGTAEAGRDRRAADASAARADAAEKRLEHSERMTRYLEAGRNRRHADSLSALADRMGETQAQEWDLRLRSLNLQGLRAQAAMLQRDRTSGAVDPELVDRQLTHIKNLMDEAGKVTPRPSRPGAPPGAAPGGPPSSSPTAGAAPRLVKYQGQLVPFESLPPELQRLILQQQGAR